MRKTAIVAVVMLMSVTVQAAEFDQQRALEFIRACRIAPDTQMDLRYVYLLSEVFNTVEKPFDAAPYQSHTRSLQNPDGGFGFWTKDVSTVGATFQALTVLEHAKAKPRDTQACIKYLKSSLDQASKAVQTYNDLQIHRDIHACLISLAMLGQELDDPEKYIKIFEQDSQAWGIYYRISAAKALGYTLPERERLIDRLDTLATEQFLTDVWWDEDQVCALEAMVLLGGQFTQRHWISVESGRVVWGPREDNRFDELVAVRNKVRKAKALDLKTPWLEEWLEKSTSFKLEPVGTFAETPGTEAHYGALLAAYRSMRDRGGLPPAPELFEKWKDKQHEDGFYEFSHEDVSPWFTEIDQIAVRAENTSEALIAFKLAGKKPKNTKTLLAWLNDVLRTRRDELRSDQLLCVLECFEILGARPEDPTALAEYFANRFKNDLPTVIRASSIIGVKPEFDNAGEKLSLLPDRVRTLDIPMELSVLAETFEALDLIGEDYAGTDYFLNLLGQLQNPDGGVRRPDSLHSNIYDTIAALRLAQILPRLEKRYQASRNGELSIQAKKADQQVKIDGNLSEWDSASRISFEEQSDRPAADRNKTTAMAMWDKNYLYLAFQVADTNLQAQAHGGHTVYRDDGVEFLIDPGFHRTRTYLPDDICVHVNLHGAVQDDRGTPQGTWDDSWDSTIRSAFRLDGTLNDDSDVDTGYTAEVALPWSDLGGSRPRPGARFGITLCVNDRDQEQAGYRYSDWANIPKFHVPRDWGQMELVAAP